MGKINHSANSALFLILGWILAILFPIPLNAQFSSNSSTQNKITFKGQLSAYTHYNPNNQYQWWNGARYIPQLNYQVPGKEKVLLDFEACANIYGNLGMDGFKYSNAEGQIKPYRAWARISANQFELRAGLQKINFGSASMLRPLMWFDQVDPRDPLQLTDGVWGVLGRYYFLNNANIWLWMLYGNNNPKGWESINTHNSLPEAGGRIQYPAGKGEVAISYHYRVTDGRSIPQNNILEPQNYPDKIAENRIGVDAKFDWVVGWWAEASWTNMREDTGLLTNQHLLNIGADYTFAIGNGLTITYEQLIASFDRKPFQFKEPVTFSAINAMYPSGLLDQFSVITYFDWTNKSPYFFINWQRQFNKLTLNLMGYSNPKEYRIPSQNRAQNLFAGTGIQLMIIYNH